MKSLTIELPDDQERRLRELSERQQGSPEETARGILRKRLILDRFHELCRQSEVLVRAAGLESEGDVLRAIS